MNNVDNLRAHNLKLDACTNQFAPKRTLTHTRTRIASLNYLRVGRGVRKNVKVYIVRPSIISGVCVFLQFSSGVWANACAFNGIAMGSIWTRLELYIYASTFNGSKQGAFEQTTKNEFYILAKTKFKYSTAPHTNTGREQKMTTLKVFSCRWRRHLTKDNMCALQILLLKWTK